MTITSGIIEAENYHIDQSQISVEEEEIRLAKSDPKAFKPLYERYFERIYRYVYHRVEDKEIAFDITSTVFYNALKNLQSYKNKGFPFSSWLYKIAFNEIQQHYRRTKSQPVLSLSAKALSDIIESLPENDYPINDEQLFTALEALKDDEIEIINMRFFENRSFKEIANILEMGESACKMKVYRIIEKMKQTLINKK